MKAGLWMTLASAAILACGKREAAETRQQAPMLAAATSSNGLTVSQDIGLVAGRPAQSADALTLNDPAAPPESKAIASSTDSAAPSMVIRTGQASIEIDKLDPALARIKALAAQLGGYVANSSFSGGREQVRRATL
jgi:hypothetical protein